MIKKYRALFGVLFALVTTGAFLGLIKLLPQLRFSWNLIFFFWVADAFLLCHFLFDIKKMYDFIYRKRYWIGAVVLAVLVIGKYHGASIELWNDIIEPEYRVGDGVIMGQPRSIRSDDWLVQTPSYLSQASEAVKFSSHNTVLRASDNLVTLYPNLPSADISILSTPNNIGYLFLDVEWAYSLSWWLPYFMVFFSTFELLMILTKKRKLYSLAGAIMIVLAPAVQWWQTLPCYIVGYGALAIVILHYFLECRIWQKKILLSLLFGYVGYLYIMCLYPAWQVPFGYVYLALAIWVIAQHRKTVRWKDSLYLFPAVGIIAVLASIIFIQNKEVLEVVSSTVYPGARMSTGGGPWRYLFTYVADMFYPYKHLANPPELSNI